MVESANNADNPIAHAALTKLSEKTDVLFGLLINPGLLKLPSDIQKMVIHGIQTAWSESFTTVFLSGLIFISIGILVALSVGKGRIKRDKELTEENEPATIHGQEATE